MHITVTHDLPELNQHLTTLYERLNGDLTPLMSAIGAILESSTRERFSTKKAPDGMTWESLLPDTVKTKKGNPNILVFKGDLMRSITFHASSESVVVGTDRHYGKYHQLGGINLVARPFLGLSEDDKSTISDLIEDFINGDL